MLIVIPYLWYNYNDISLLLFLLTLNVKYNFLGYNYPYRKLKKIQELGQGNFARVSQCEAEEICGRPGKTLVAVKQLKGETNILFFQWEKIKLWLVLTLYLPMS